MVPFFGADRPDRLKSQRTERKPSQNQVATHHTGSRPRSSSRRWQPRLPRLRVGSSRACCFLLSLPCSSLEISLTLMSCIPSAAASLALRSLALQSALWFQHSCVHTLLCRCCAHTYSRRNVTDILSSYRFALSLLARRDAPRLFPATTDILTSWLQAELRKHAANDDMCVSCCHAVATVRTQDYGRT